MALPVLPFSRIQSDEPESIEGILIRHQKTPHGCFVEIATGCKAVSEMLRYDEDGKRWTTRHYLLGYDPAKAFKGIILIAAVPARPFPHVRLTRTREHMVHEGEDAYAINTYLHAVLEDVDKGTYAESMGLDFSVSGQAIYRRALEGILEPAQRSKAKALARQHAATCTVVGIRKPRKAHATAVALYVSSAELALDTLYHRQVRLVEGIWRHAIDRMGTVITFEQELTDAMSGTTYRGGTVVDTMDSHALEKWKGQATPLCDDLGTRL